MGVLARLTAVTVAVTLGVAGCVTHTETEGTVLTVGMSPGPYSIIFKDGIEPLLKAKGYTVNYHVYRDLNEATDALVAGNADLSVEQYPAYTELYNKAKGATLVNIDTLPTIPAALYSKEHRSVEEVAPGQTVAIPRTPAERDRAMELLQEAGFITESDDRGLTISESNSEDLPVELPKVDWVVLPGSVSYPVKADPHLQVMQEDMRPELLRAITVWNEDADSAWVADVRAAYHDPAFISYMNNDNVNDYWYVP